MRRSKFTEEPITFASKQVEIGVNVAECCRKMGISDQTFYRWKKKWGVLGVAEVRRLKMLEKENRTVKQLVADPRIAKVMLQDALRRKL